MHRIFLSLYGVILLAIIAAGWGLDKLWQTYANETDTSLADAYVFELAELFLADSATPINDKLQHLQTKTHAQFKLHQTDEFANSQFIEDLIAGQLVVIESKHERIFYHQLNNSTQILSWRIPTKQIHQPILYNLFLIFFYLTLAMVVLLWVWPLSRDLRKLEQQTKLLGTENGPNKVQLAPTSAVYDLASAFNRMADRIRELLESHKEMTHAVSHELRTPLARMKFALEMAKDMQDTHKIQQQLLGVRQDVTEMDILVQQLLAYASFEQGNGALNLQCGDMQALIHQLIAQLQWSPQTRNIQFTFINRLSDANLVCEWYLMERALLNLLQNAQRYAATQVTVTLEKQAEFFTISIDDDGPGIPENQRERIFNSFFRLTDSTNAEIRGLGLGLAIVKRILKWHKGKAFAETSSLGGAKLVIRWPDLQAGISY
jgi:two-component system, OmpR family, sensor kinase